MKKLCLLLMCVCWAGQSVMAQNNIVKSLESDVPGQGKVTIHQDARIEALIGQKYIPSATGEQQVLKVAGYRVQVFAGNNTRQAKNEAYGVAAALKEMFPDLVVYTSFMPPRWLCRAGDFSGLVD